MRALLLSSLLLTACKWTEFDDLRDEAWVNATARPDNGSTNWGLAIQRSNRTSPSGGKLTVLGTAQSIYNEIEYDANGGATIAANEQKLGVLGVANLDTQPILLADPDTDDVALIASVGVQQVLVLRGQNGQFTGHNVFGADGADAAAYIVAPLEIADVPNPATPMPAQPLVGAKELLLGTLYVPPSTPFQPKCRMVDGDPTVVQTTVQVRALAAFRPTGAMFDSVLMWGANGRLYILPSGVFNGGVAGGACPDVVGSDGIGDFNVQSVASVDTSFIPDAGSQIFVLADGVAILQGHNAQNASHLGAYDLRSGTPVALGGLHPEPGLKTATIWQDGTNFAVVAGYPNEQVDGVNAGQVRVYDVDTTAGTGGIATAPTEVLNDAQPEDGLSFGRALAVIPFNNRPVIAVGANNEVFLYFRTANLYNDDTRQNR